MTPHQIRTMLENPDKRDQALDQIGEWAKDNCLMQCATPSTSYIVAWVLVEGIAATWDGRKPNYRVCK